MSEIKKNALGRGLSSLLSPKGEENVDKEEIAFLALERVEKGNFQPRKYFPEEDLQELASSIKEKGVLQPILVRALGGEKYELIAGERRWRAAKIAEINKIPAIIRHFSDKEVLEIGLLENIQRQDLNPIEEAEGYQRLAEEFNHTQETLSRILGKSRSHIANTLRLLMLPRSVQDYLVSGKLSSGHGRSLIGVENSEKIAEMIISRRLSVRQAEALARQRDSLVSPHSANPEKELLQDQLSSLTDWPVEVSLKGRGGKISFGFKDPIELDKLINKFNKLKKSLEFSSQKN